MVTGALVAAITPLIGLLGSGMVVCAITGDESDIMPTSITAKSCFIIFPAPVLITCSSIQTDHTSRFVASK